MIKIWLDKSIEGGHSNLFLEFSSSNFIQVADTYYFALDNFFMEGEESSFKVRQNLKNLLNKWISLIEKMKVNQKIYLPFDFSDEYIGCLRVDKISEFDLQVGYGSTRRFDGTSISPSQIEEFVIDDEVYSSSIDNIKIDKKLLLKNIQESIQDIV
jgi:hypothetical protein